MRRQLTIGQKLTAGCCALLAFLLIAFGLSAWTTRAARDNQREATAVAERVRMATEVDALNSSMFAAEKAMMVAGAAGDMERLMWWHERVKGVIDQGHRTVADLQAAMPSDAERRRARQLAEGMKAWEKGCLACHDATADMGDAAKMQKLSEHTQQLMEANAALSAAIAGAQRKDFDESSARLQAEADRALGLQGLVLGLSLLVGAVVLRSVRAISAWLARTAHDLREGVAHVFDAASQMSSASQSLSQGASEQAASLEETRASMNEMASMTAQNARHSADAASLASEAGARVQAANGALSHMVASMASIEDNSTKVAKILRVVDEIAFQTNILALNAAVEAARAGEAGMGFAVVADEVRTLAQRSAQSARDTAALIEDAMRATAQGQANVQEMSQAIASVTDAITRVQQLAAQVHEASAQQKQGFDQVTVSLQQIEKATQTTAASAEEAAATSETLNAEAEVTLASVEQLAAMAGAHRAAAGHGGPAGRGMAQLLRWHGGRRQDSAA
jgi:methyl-accepting chemotaxis protein/methyl-accepting chemotaxis protein-1 (serine sensor receptor)